MNDTWLESDVGPLSDSDEDHAASLVWIWASPLIFGVGILGNSLSLVVFCRMGFGRSPTNVYLSCVATADNGVLLLGLLPQWLKQSGIVVLHELCPIACQVKYFCAFTSGDTAIWLLAVFTADRAAAVRFPLRRFRATSTRCVLALCACVLACACAKNAHVFWTRGAVVDADSGALISNCASVSGYENFEAFVRPWIAFCVVSVAPLVVVLVSNAVIIRVLVGYHDRQRMNIIMSNAERHFRQTTFMCLAVSVAFFVCVTPNFALLIGRPYWEEAVADRSVLNVTDAVNNLLLYLNHSINFFLYCLAGRVFRKEFVAMFTRSSRRVDSSTESDSRRVLRWVRELPQHQMVAVVPLDSAAESSNIDNCNKETVTQEADVRQSTRL